MHRILVTGSSGQVGFELVRSLGPLGEIHAPASSKLDLASPSSIARVIREVRPSVIVNAAAYTAVDQAETDRDRCRRINSEAPGIIAEEARALEAVVVHYSTDYVFDGLKGESYVEDDPPNPLNVYGETKWKGEEAIREVGGKHLILRTSWVYGARGKNFLRTIQRLARELKPLRIVADQYGAPTSSRALAAATALILARTLAWGQPGDAPWGTYHVTAPDFTSWFGFAQAIVAASENATGSVTPISTEEYPTPARRPRFSVLSPVRASQRFGVLLPSWRTQLSCLFEEQAQN